MGQVNQFNARNRATTHFFLAKLSARFYKIRDKSSELGYGDASFQSGS